MNKITIGEPSLPDFSLLEPYLREIWKTKRITNNGPFLRQFEEELSNFFRVPHVSVTCNATLALLLSIKSMNITGSVITTPFSFVASSSVLLWSNIKPIFVDIDLFTLGLDPSKIQDKLDPNVSALLPVHVFGRPSNVHAFEEISKQNNLKLIYDASHCFGTNCDCGSLLQHGDMSIVSFHATKVFNTFEGGCMVTTNSDLKDKFDRMRNFGYSGGIVSEIGINAKMSEIHAAIGLVQLRSINSEISARKKIDSYYRTALKSIEGIQPMDLPVVDKYNHCYFPVLVSKEFPLSRDELLSYLQTKLIYAKAYFYPLISSLAPFKDLVNADSQQLPNAFAISEQILCLPIHSGLSDDDLSRICYYLRRVCNRKP